MDERDDEHSEFKVEPAAAVRRRTLAGVRALEARHVGKTFVLVSHGDALQITQTVRDCPIVR